MPVGHETTASVGYRMVVSKVSDNLCTQYRGFPYHEPPAQTAMTRQSLLHAPPPACAVETPERVRWSDSDPFGIIYYGAYIRLFQVGEEELFRAAGLPFRELRLGRGVWIPRKALEMEFHSPAELDEAVVIRSWFARIGRTAITIRFDVHRAEDLLHRASGALTVVSVHKESMTPQPLPDDVRERLLRLSA